MNKNIGDMTKSELIDFIIELQEENSRYERKNEKYKETINKLSESMEGHYDGFTSINEFGACNDIIELLLEFKDILKDVEFIKKWSD